uniref:Uncharacterized protein n=1 Tax=Globodera pallida TaxID=36090 RepID=A0A183BRG1_GLOPA
MDFFGLSNSSSPPPEKRLKMGEEEQTLDAQMFIDDVAPGPSKPVKWAEPDSELNEEQRRRRIAQLRAISDEEAQKLIYDRELAPFGANPLIAQDAVNQIVDVSVDNALGPNVRENLLRNLSGKQMAQLPLGPLPKMKKSDSDKLAKRKHQITHLATVAVSREEQLQEKWADSKQTKKMSRQKYGF